MENQIKEVKNILDKVLVKYPVSDYPYRSSINERYAKEICQLFEPKPSEIPIDQTIANPATNAPKPEGKPPLLSDEEIERLTKRGPFETYFSHYPHIVAQAQWDSDIKWIEGE